MQPSRLAQRKLNTKPKVKPKKRSFLKISVAIIFLILIFIAFIIWHFGLFSVWNGKDKFSIVSQNPNGDVVIEILDPANGGITNITIPAATELQAANQLGTWKLGSITKLGLDKNLGNDFLKNTIIKSFNFPIDTAKENLTILDKIRIKSFELSVGNTNTTNLNLKDTNYLIRSQLVDGSLGWEIADSMPINVEVYFNQNPTNENLNVLINDESGTGDEGTMMGKVTEVLGYNVASLQELNPQKFDCKITGVSQTVVYKIAKIFSCNANIGKPANNFDLQIDLGTDFTTRF